MGISVEFNPDLALRDMTEYKAGRRKKEECIPEPLRKGKIYRFLKSGQRNYFFHDEIPLLKTTGNQRLSRPLASIVMLEATHFSEKGKTYTKGRYKVIDVFRDDTIHFESYARLSS